MPRIIEFIMAVMVLGAIGTPHVLLAPCDTPNGVRRAASLLAKKHLCGPLPLIRLSNYRADAHSLSSQ